MQGPSYLDFHNSQKICINEFCGILPRTAKFIFQEFTRLSKLDHNYKMFISAVEIYNENIYDLLCSSEEKIALTIFSTKDNKNNVCIFKLLIQIQITNLKWIEIKNEEDIIIYTKEASKSRRTDSTTFNDTSSRSHAIYQLQLRKVDKKKGGKEELLSYINIVDLAGSERSQKASVNVNNKEEIEKIKKNQIEANYINKSLTSLGRIISILGEKKSKIVIPYRESKLTMMLQVIFSLIFF